MRVSIAGVEKGLRVSSLIGIYSQKTYWHLVIGELGVISWVKD